MKFYSTTCPTNSLHNALPYPSVAELLFVYTALGRGEKCLVLTEAKALIPRPKPGPES
ncbi:hypothetical protein ZHAS_00019306 [Anopheles sinensis]|uniref:Uncharacterized protein n=1 Tax=Anopheles sinensis TaxID=74873 RepID=A0A084WM16_ANOSI|nr:hypothetical protein ZHAS_00019306 [Anopheles sinensis]